MKGEPCIRENLFYAYFKDGKTSLYGIFFKSSGKQIKAL
jgi:hypothetical protein